MKIGTHETHAPCVSHSVSLNQCFLLFLLNQYKYVINVYLYTTKNHS